jgi:hypothetical protein
MQARKFAVVCRAGLFFLDDPIADHLAFLERFSNYDRVSSARSFSSGCVIWRRIGATAVPGLGI